jgi:hypothetical protein
MRILNFMKLTVVTAAFAVFSQTVSAIPISGTTGRMSVNMLKAASRGDAAAVEKYLEEGADVNYKNAKGESLLCVAKKKGDAQAVSILQNYGASDFNCNYKKQEKRKTNSRNSRGNYKNYYATPLETGSTFDSPLTTSNVLMAGGAAAGIYLLLKEDDDEDSDGSGTRDVGDDDDDDDGADSWGYNGTLPPGPGPVVVNEVAGGLSFFIHTENREDIYFYGENENFQIQEFGGLGYGQNFNPNYKEEYLETVTLGRIGAYDAYMQGYNGYYVNREGVLEGYAPVEVDEGYPYVKLSQTELKRVKVGVVDTGFDIINGNIHSELEGQYYTADEIDGVSNFDITDDDDSDMRQKARFWDQIEKTYYYYEKPPSGCESGDMLVYAPYGTGSFCKTEESDRTGVNYMYADHGSHVAGIIAAKKDNDGEMHGVAYNSKLIPISADIGALDERGPGAGNMVAVEAGAAVINNSWGWGISGPNDVHGSRKLKEVLDNEGILAAKDLFYNSWEESAVQDNGVDDNQYSISHLYRQQAELYSPITGEGGNSGRMERTVFVFSAGNDGLGGNDSQVHIDAAAPLVFPSLQGFFITVGSVIPVSGGYNLADYSNGCGEAKDWCLMALGGDTNPYLENGVLSLKVRSNPEDWYIPGETIGEDYMFMQGTSMASPQVTAAYAILRGAFPYLYPDEIVSILFATATPLGNEWIYGHGLLNLKAATEPYGEIRVGTSTKIKGASHSIDDTSAEFSNLFNQKAINNLMDQNLMVLDEFDRGFYVRMGDLMNIKNEEFNATAKIAAFGKGWKEKDIKISDMANLRLSMNEEYYMSEEGFDGEKTTELREVTFGIKGEKSTHQMAYAGDLTNKMSEDVGYMKGLSDLRVSEESIENPYLNLADEGVYAFQDMKFGTAKLGIGSYFAKGDAYDTAEDEVIMTSMHGNDDDEDNEKDKIFGMFANLKKIYGNTGLYANFGYMQEEKNMLGSELTGAFDIKDDVKTYYYNLGAKQKLGDNLAMFANYSYGVTNINPEENSLFDSYSDIKTSALSFGVDHKSEESNTRKGIIFSKPMYVEEAYATLMIPAYRTVEEVVMYEEKVNLANEYDQYNIEGYLSYDMFNNGRLNLGAEQVIYDGLENQNSTTFMMKYSLGI